MDEAAQDRRMAAYSVKPFPRLQYLRNVIKAGTFILTRHVQLVVTGTVRGTPGMSVSITASLDLS